MLEYETLKGELAESTDLIKDKDVQLERIYKMLSEKQANTGKNDDQLMEDVSSAPA